MNDQILVFGLSHSEFTEIVEKTILKVLESTKPQPGQDQTFITISEACKLLSVSRVTIYDLINTGQLKKHKIRRATRLLRSDVMNLVNQIS